MAKVAITESYLQDIADAIREKTGLTNLYYPSQMAPAIMTISGSGGITPTGTISITTNGTYNVTQYANASVNVPTGSTINNQNKSVTPTKAQQQVTYDNGYTGLGIVTVNAIPANYIIPTGNKEIIENGTDIDVAEFATVSVDVSTDSTIHNQNKTVSPSTSQQTVTFDSGYTGLGTVTVNAMPTGTAGTPSASKGTVSNHSISVTPSVTNTTGYITGSTKTGTAVTVSASELVSGTLSVTSNGTKDVTNYASVNVSVSDDAPTLQAKTYTVNSAGTATVTADNGYDGLSSVAVSVPSADVGPSFVDNFITQNNARKWTVTYGADLIDAGWFGSSVEHSSTFNAVPSNTAVNPTESSQTIGGANYMMEGAVTVNAIPSNYVGSGITQRSSSDLTASGATVTVPSGYYSAQASKAVASGTEGMPTATKGTVSNHQVSVTPSVTNTSGYITGSTKTGTAVTVSASELVSGTYTVDSSGTKDVTNYASALVPSGTAGTPSASKGAVSNHSISVTPSVTNTTGWITGSTKTGTAVTVSASELVSGSQTITSNQTVDVTNLAELVVNVGGGTPMQIETDIVASSYTSSTLTFTGLKGEPKAFWVIHGAAIATGTPSKVASIVFDGTSMHGQIVTNTSNAQASYSTNFSYTYSNGTLTITSSNATFISTNYILTYAYGGGVVDTKDVQVGSGATSITFTGLEAEPALWSCIFKSNFSTSNGYQRVMYVEHENDFTIGFYMDSSANPNPTYWSYSYNNGSLTITSQGTNAGGYFHQPGYYQLTYAYDDGGSGNYQSKTVTPTTSQQVVEADSGYDALKRVTVNAMPSGSATAPASISGTAASVSTGTNTLTLTKTVSVTPTVSAGYISAGTAGNSSVSLTASVTTKAAATITPTTTNQTIAAGTYLTGTQTIAGDADLVGSNILSTANIFGVQGTVDFIDVYIRSAAPTSSVGNDGDIYIQE